MTSGETGRDVDHVAANGLEPSGRGTKLSVSETGFNEISIARRAKVFADNTGGWTEVIVWIQQHVEASR